MGRPRDQDESLEEEKVTKDSKKRKSESNGKHKKDKSADKYDDDSTNHSSTKKQKTENGKKHEDVEMNGNGESPQEESGPGAFINFRISPESCGLLQKRGVTHLFPIQYETFDYVYDNRDIIGRARTGTGKTLAFALPIVERIKANNLSTMKPGRKPLVLVMAPTRELAKQISADFESIAPNLAIHCVYGGVPYSTQENALRKGLDIIIGTPGRLLDFLNRGILKLDNLSFVVLDEADEMLDIGFADSMEEILSRIPKEKERQTCLFSATIPPWVSNVASKYLKKDHIVVDLVGDEKVKSNELIQHLAINCSRQEQLETLADLVKVYGGTGRVIIFADRKADVNNIATNSSINSICQGLHGDIPQSQREVTLAGFREGKFTCLVATDVAARGLDISNVDLVIQMSPPGDPETYIHRVGRTARGGKKGTAITFYQHYETFGLSKIEQRVGFSFKRIGTPQPGDLMRAAAEKAKKVIEAVNTDVLTHFVEVAQNLIEEKGEVNALAAALAHICGYTKPIGPKSLLGSRKGYLTVHVKDSSIYGFRDVKTALVYFCEGNLDLGEVKVCEGGAIADVPAEMAQEIVKKSKEMVEKNKGRSMKTSVELLKSLSDVKLLDLGGTSTFSGGRFARDGQSGRGRSGGYSRGGRGGYGGGGGRGRSGGYGRR